MRKYANYLPIEICTNPSIFDVTIMPSIFTAKNIPRFAREQCLGAFVKEFCLAASIAFLKRRYTAYYFVRCETRLLQKTDTSISRHSELLGYSRRTLFTRRKSRFLQKAQARAGRRGGEELLSGAFIQCPPNAH